MSSGSDAESRVGKIYAATGNELLRGFTRPATWRSFTWGNEKFHLSPTSQHWNAAKIIGKFGGADQLLKAVNQLQMLLYAA
jgi:hypothetical protein